MHKMISWAVVAGVALAGGCKSSSEKKATEAVAGGSIGAETMGTFTCTNLKDDVCVEPTDKFTPTSPVIYLTYKTKDLPENGAKYVIKWIAEDVGAAAPANTAIATLNETVSDAQAGMKNYVVNSKLSKPTAGWPVGRYRVEVSYGDKLVTTARFSVQ